MPSTVARLWTGNIPALIDLGANDPKVKQLETLLRQQSENLKNTLDEDQKKLFMEYDDSWGEYLLAVGARAFCDGFSLGIKLITESLSATSK